MEFNYENQGNKTYLVVTIVDNTELDSVTLGMITNNHIAGIAPMFFSQMNEEKRLNYDVSAKITLSQYFQNTVKREQVLKTFLSIANAVVDAEEYLIEPESFCFDSDYMYVDVSKKDVTLICLPIVREDVTGLRDYFRELVYSITYDSTENSDYMARLMTYLHREEFSIYHFKELVSELLGGQNGTVNTVVQQNNPQRENMQPAAGNTNVVVNTNVVSGNMGQMANANYQTTMQYTPAQQNNTGYMAQQAQNASAVVGTPVSPAPNAQPTVASSGIAIPAKEEKKKEKGKKLFGKKEPNPQTVEKKKEKKGKEKKVAPPSNAVQSQGFAIPNQNISINNPQGRPVPQNVQPQSLAGAERSSGTMMNTQSQPMQSPSNMMGQQNSFLQQNVVSQQNMMSQQNSVLQTQPQTAHQTIPQQNMNMQQPAQPQQSVTNTANYGGTVVLGNMGETTVLNAAMINSMHQPKLVRAKNQEIINIDKAIFRIGKERSYVDYFIGDNTAVSRSHANIISRDGEYFIMDTNSTNHTYVNGSMIQSNVEVKLSHGTKIMLANEEFEFHAY